MPDIQLTGEQQNAILAIMTGIRKHIPTQTLGGYAGTGKTTVINFLCQEALPNFAVCAFTGKAANVLRRRGVEGASTIHSLIYEPQKDANGNVVFELRTGLGCDGIIVDEASMVSREIYEDLMTFGLPIVFVGDHGQLEPVGSDFNLMKSPDYRLERIHRNAGEISRFAEWLRMDRNAVHFPMGTSGEVEFVSKWEADERGLLTDVDQIICAYNRTRVLTNTEVRKQLGRTEVLPSTGERVMCLRNNKKHLVYNGMQGVVQNRRTQRGRHYMNFESYGQQFTDVSFNPEQFNQEKTIPQEDKDDPIPFDYAYCITAHKSQGDEWNTTMVFEQRCKGWEHRRWTYTAASRAKQKIYWVRGM